MTSEFDKELSRDPSDMDHVLCMIALLSFVLQIDVIYRNYPLNVSENNLPIDLWKQKSKALMLF